MGPLLASSLLTHEALATRGHADDAAWQEFGKAGLSEVPIFASSRVRRGAEGGLWTEPERNGSVKLWRRVCMAQPVSFVPFPTAYSRRSVSRCHRPAAGV